jgi:hypothetical protein
MRSDRSGSDTTGIRLGNGMGFDMNTDRPSVGPRRAVAIGCGLMIAAIAGCSGETGPQRYRVQGTVTYDGQPLQFGRISFVPDAAKGTKGPPGYALVREGRYDTDAVNGKGAVPGAIRVLITGYDLSAPEEEEALPNLFTDHPIEITIEPSRSAIVHDFVVEKRRR